MEANRQHESLAHLARTFQAVLDGDIDVVELRADQAAWHLSALRALRDVASSGQAIRQDIYNSYVSAASVWLDSQVSATVRWTRNGEVGMTPAGSMICRQDKLDGRTIWAVFNEWAECVGQYESQAEAVAVAP